jgi:hypothetical protein
MMQLPDACGSLPPLLVRRRLPLTGLAVTTAGIARRSVFFSLRPSHRRRYDALPTARTTLRTGYVRVLVFCRSCRHQADADLRAIINAGRGDVPLTERPAAF